MADIPNTIPSNQLKNPVIIQENQDSQPCTQDSLFMSQYSEKNRKSFEELENLSFNLDTTGNNTANDTINEPVNTQQNEEILDELAMLCSGQFRTETQKKTSQKEQKKKDLYEFEDDDDDLDEEEKLIKKFRKQKEIEENEQDLEEEEEEEEEVGEEENEDDNEISDDEEEEELDEEIEIRDEETRPKSREQKLKIRKKKKEEYKKALEKDGFFEEEAELSGDEKDEDDDYDGDSADNDSIVCSGDEDKNLPSDSELKEQLGRIYLKDKMDEDKRQLRLIKEMYIGEKEEKNSRRKNFRWKHIDDNLGVGFHSDSSEQEDADDNDDEDDKKNNFFKSVANGDWRSNRHEREQFVKQNIRKENLLSDDEDQDEEKDEEDADSCLRIFGSSANQAGNQLLKKGQMLLKKKSIPIRPSVSQKRPFEDEKTNQSRIVVQKIVQSKKNDQKFSFLNRDKSYLSRLSNYVNKNLTDKVSFKTVRPNNMIFSVLDSSEPQMNDENKIIQIKNSNKQTQLDSNDLESKRAKYDYSKSIFNHL